jgi:hypothetical protein
LIYLLRKRAKKKTKMSNKADSRRAAAVSEALPTFGVGAVVALMGIRGFTATKSIPRFGSLCIDSTVVFHLHLFHLLI